MASPPTPVLEPSRPVFLVGPTGTGKSALGLRWAQAARRKGADCAILCLDSMQIYRGADVGTGKPTAEERTAFPHGGLDLADIGEDFDVARYCEYARSFLEQHANRPVLVIGGTGLYFRALTQGLSKIPPVPPELRAELTALSPDERLARLRAADPGICEQLDTANPRRVQRALEVLLATGTSLLEWQRKGNGPPVVGPHEAFLLHRERDDLRRRIAKRVSAMFEAGWIEETARLVEAHGLEIIARFPAIGYGAIAHALAEVGLDPSALPPPTRARLIEKVTQLTHQYARRQLTWFRREPTLHVLELA
ncbi:MAG: tRNA (adenosine(37)-N6)-dimethylallyltransferase MiaA [Verrucomicrobiota bacterium]